MYLYVSEIFPTEIRPIGMGFSLFGQFAGEHVLWSSVSNIELTFIATLILLQTAPMGFGNVGWKYYLVIICWSVFFIPGKKRSKRDPFEAQINSQLKQIAVIYFFFPETARLTLEEIAQNFGEEVAVHLTDATDEEKAQLDNRLVDSGANIETSVSSDSAKQGNDAQPSIDGEQNVTKAE